MTPDFTKYFRLVLDSRYVLFINILDRLFFFIFFLFIARNYSTESYGQAITLFTLSTVFVAIFDLGLPLYLQRELSLSRIAGSELFSKLFFLNLLMFAVYFGFLYLAYAILYPQIPFLLFVIIALIMFESSLLNLCNKALAGINDFKSQFTAMWLARLYVLALVIVGIRFFSFDLASVISVLLAGFFLQLINLLWILDKRGIALSFHFLNPVQNISIIKISLPLGIAVIFNFLYDKIDVLIISKLLDFSQAAFYNVGYGIFKASALAFSFILVTGFTRVSSFSLNKNAVRLFFIKYLKLILIICIPMAAAVFFLSGLIINTFYTNKFSDSIIILKLLSPAIIAMGCNNLTGIVLNGIGLFKVVMYITLFGLIINIILNFAFIPVYGIKAAAVITCVTEYFILFLELYYLAKVLNIRISITNS